MKKSYKIEVDCANCANQMEEAANNGFFFLRCGKIIEMLGRFCLLRFVSLENLNRTKN